MNLLSLINIFLFPFLAARVERRSKLFHPTLSSWCCLHRSQQLKLTGRATFPVTMRTLGLGFASSLTSVSPYPLTVMITKNGEMVGKLIFVNNNEILSISTFDFFAKTFLFVKTTLRQLSQPSHTSGFVLVSVSH